MKALLKFLFIFICLFFFFTKLTFAEEISSFNSKLTAHEDGTFNITETIVYDFGQEYKHGIFRTIPKTSKVGDLYRKSKITLQSISRDNKEENYLDQSSDSTFKVRIGNADKTITGAHTYNISYLVENGTTTYDDHDEIYWNITGNEWEAPIQKASVDILSDFNTKPTNFICFTGSFGSKEQSCIVIHAKAGIQGTWIPDQVGDDMIEKNSTSVRFETVDRLNPGEGLTIAVAYPPKTFPPSILNKEDPNGISDETLWLIIILVFGAVILLNIVLPLILVIWYFKAKRKSRFGAVTVNFDIPKDRVKKRLAPAEAGTIDTAMLDRDDVTGTIFDLAIRKFIKMEEVEKKILLWFGSSKTIKLVKLKEYKSSVISSNVRNLPTEISHSVRDDNSLVSSFEKILLDRLFEEGNEIEVNDLKQDFYKTFNEMGDAVFKDHVSRGFYTKNPKNQRTLLTVLGFLSIVFGGIILGIVLLVLSRKLNGRTELGDEIDWKIDGLKLFLRSMDRNYKWQADKLYIVEQMIPYAIALGYMEKFMEHLKIIQPNYNPTWYSGHTPFLVYFPSISNSMNSSFVSSAPSSSSGFSGGGSSGGGGGGGGGGSW